eukprot:m.213261 g.213261  ORF g.213261 m.213261 type:complete len:233 (-) comp24436_c0_seq1:272-970(-)
MARRGGGGGDANTKVSKLLSWALRHGAEELGLHMDPAGYVAVRELLGHPRFRGISEDQLREVVANCPKQRFALDGGSGGVGGGPLRVRANQGHTLETVESEALLTPLTPADIARFPVVVHGTSKHAWLSIRRQGLSRMSRLHVHFAVGLPGADGVLSGMRASSDVLCFLDLGRAFQQGLKLYVSANNVVLTEGDARGFVPLACLDRVVDRRTGELLYTAPPPYTAEPEPAAT